MRERGYAPWLAEVMGFTPHPWQVRMGDALECVDRLIRIPTGFGKTAGTVLPWLYRRVVCADRSWPTRLVFCLPMRTLVEQTEAAIEGWLERAGVTDHHRTARGEFDAWLEGELRRALEQHGLPAPLRVEPVPELRRQASDLSKRWIEFRRARKGDDQRLGYGFRLAFPVEVTGPFAVGYGSHFGLGVFRKDRKE